MAVFLFKKNILLMYFLLFCMLGNLVYFLFPFPPVIWRLLFVFISLYLTSLSLISKQSLGIEKIITLFAFINLLYFAISYLWLEPSTTQIGNILYSMLSFPAFIYLGRKGVLTEKFLFWSLILLFIFSVPAFYHAKQLALAKLLYGDQVTINASSYFVMLLPLCIINYKKLVTKIIFFLSIVFILMAAKRGNIVAAVIPSAFFLYLIFKDSKKSIFNKILYVAIFILVGMYIYDMVLNNEYLLNRFEDMLEGNSSGRDVVYANKWNYWYNSDSIINLFFGYGFDGTISTSDGLRAHNDWLEILVCNGLLGVFTYLSIFIKFFESFVKGHNLYIKFILVSVISIWFLKTLFSMAYTDEVLAFLALPLSYYFIKMRNEK